MKRLEDVLKSLSTEEAQAILAALGQYVENGQCNDEVEDPYAADPLLKPAEDVLDRLNEALASLAEG